MSPHRHQRRAAWAMIAGVVAITALVLSVWLVGARAANGIRDSERRARQNQAHRDQDARLRQTIQLRAGCARSVARDFESWATNRDLRDLARDAARARRAQGDTAIARRYARRAARADFRMRRIRLRLPQDESQKTVGRFCVGLYPEPTPQG